MVKHRRFLSRRLRPALVLMLAVLLSVLPSVGLRSIEASTVQPEKRVEGLIPFQDQPFYPALEQMQKEGVPLLVHGASTGEDVLTFSTVPTSCHS